MPSSGEQRPTLSLLSLSLFACKALRAFKNCFDEGSVRIFQEGLTGKILTNLCQEQQIHHHTNRSPTFPHFISVQFETGVFLFAGCENDDYSCHHLRRVLAPLSPIFHHDIDVSCYYRVRTRSGNISGHLLAGDEQFNVQSNNLLLDECEVSEFLQFSHLNIQ